MTAQWAYDRVRELVDAQTKPGWHEEHMLSGAAHAFARYVEEHEDAPMEPRDAIASIVRIGDAYATADRAIKALEDAGFQIVKGGAA